jgi:hypothetical protein
MAEPFLTYLTVFKSRLALANLILEVTGMGHQSPQAVRRKIKQTVERRVDLDLGDASNSRVFEHLLSKHLLSPEGRSDGRYRGYALRQAEGGWQAETRGGAELVSLPVFLVDIWMSHPQLASTIGAPTPDNVEELLELGYQLRLISRAKNTWTSAGHTSRELRQTSRHLLDDPNNPFLLAVEALVLLRQIIEVDGLVLRELVRGLAPSGEVVTRDNVARQFDEVIDRAVGALKGLRSSPAELRAARDFAKTVANTSKRRGSMSRAPGLLEHRVSPRLEWLTDLGYLTKPSAKNEFVYRVEPSANDLLEALDGHFGSHHWGDSIALEQWSSNATWKELRKAMATLDGGEAFRTAYRILRRRIGPSPIREVAFVSGLLSNAPITYEEAVSGLVDFAKHTDGVSLSGGRYQRSPESVYMTEQAFGQG